MKDFIVRIKNLSLVTIIASLVIGVVLLVWPDESVSIVSILCGAALILLGIVSWITYFAKDRSTLIAVLGTVTIIIGIIVCIRYKDIIAVILFLFGLFVTISGAVDFITSFYTKSRGMGSWALSAVLSLAAAALGVVIMINPNQTVSALVRLAGAGLLVYAVVDLITFIQVRKAAKEIAEEFKNVEPPVVESEAQELDESGDSSENNE